MLTQLTAVKISAALLILYFLFIGRLSFAGLCIVAFLVSLVALARYFPLFGRIVGALFLIGSPVTAWLVYDPKLFHTEGSAAGLVLPFIFLILIFFLMGLGFSMIKVTITEQLEMSDHEKAKFILKVMKGMAKTRGS
ncbi:MAG: hypothetical protein WBP46_18915 [Thiolinea sp.]